MALVESLSVPSVALVAISVFVIVRHILYPVFFSPLAKIPNAHPLAAFTPAWITWIRYTNVENRTIHEAHKRHGAVVRLGPSELSVNCVDHGIKTIYGKGFDKTPYYSFFANFGILNMFSTLQSHPHSAKKKRISNIYSKSFLKSSADVQAVTSHIIHERIIPLLANKAETNTPIDVYPLYLAVALDLTTSYFFGLPVGTNFIEDGAAFKKWNQQYLQSRPVDGMFFLQHLPHLTRLLTKLGIHVVSKDRLSVNDEVDAWCLEKCTGAEKLLDKAGEPDERQPGHYPVVYDQLKRTTKKDKMSEDPSIHLNDSAARQTDNEAGEILNVPRSPQQLEIASELLDQLIATHGTVGASLLYTSWELSRNEDMQRRLRAELRSLPIPLERGSDEKLIPDARTLDELPLLHAIVMETLRLHSPVAGTQPRVTPPGSLTQVGDHAGIPSGTIVSSNAWSLHRNPDVFPDPEGWHPERWLEGEDSEYAGNDKKDRWFWAFSSGSRMCIGSNFAMQMMKFVLAGIYTNFVSIIEDDEGIEQTDGFIVGPKSDKLILKFQLAPQET